MRGVHQLGAATLLFEKQLFEKNKSPEKKCREKNKIKKCLSAVRVSLLFFVDGLDAYCGQKTKRLRGADTPPIGGRHAI